MPHIAVAGAGIGGLTTALALAAAGHQVTVLERRPALAEYGAGLQLSPNATRILRDLGILDTLGSCCVKPQAVRVRRGRDAADLIHFPLGSSAEARYGAPFLLALRPDLQRVLAADVERHPAIDLRFGCGVTAAAPTPGGSATVETSDGTFEADGFVDCRGVGVAKPQASGRLAWRALVPASRLLPDALRPETNLWLGPKTHLVHYPVPDRGRVNVVAVTEAFSDTAGDDELWSRKGDPARLLRAFAGWHRDAMRFVDPDSEWRCWPLLTAPPRSAWSQGPITIAGDAAHPMMPFLAQGASQAIEDAGALAAALCGQTDVPAAFAAYERQRRQRAERVQAVSKQQGDIYHLRRPASDARDVAMRLLGGERALARLDWLYGAEAALPHRKINVA